MPEGIDIETLSVPELEHMLNVFSKTIDDFETKCPDCTPPPVLTIQRDRIENLLGEKKKLTGDA